MRDEEEAAGSERGTEAESDQEDEDDREEEEAAVTPGPYGWFIFSLHINCSTVT